MIKPIEKHVTIRDVAKAAGVSKSTVSKALNDKPDISAALRKKVFETCEALDYQINYRIQDMVRERKNGSTQNIAFVLVGKEFADPAYSRVIDGIASGAEENNLHLMLEKLSGEEKAIYDLPPVLRDSRVDGIIITGELNESIVSIFDILETPYVILGIYRDKITRNAVNILPNIESGLIRMVEKLKENGKRRIAWFTEDPDNFAEKSFLALFKTALIENDLAFYPELVYNGNGSFSGALKVMHKTFRKPELPFDSIVCLDFRSAQEISHLVIGRCGLERKPDICICTSRPYKYYSLPVPAIYIEGDANECAYQGINSLVEIIQKKDIRSPRKIIINTKLIH